MNDTTNTPELISPADVQEAVRQSELDDGEALFRGARAFEAWLEEAAWIHAARLADSDEHQLLLAGLLCHFSSIGVRVGCLLHSRRVTRDAALLDAIQHVSRPIDERGGFKDSAIGQFVELETAALARRLDARGVREGDAQFAASMAYRIAEVVAARNGGASPKP